VEGSTYWSFGCSNEQDEVQFFSKRIDQTLLETFKMVCQDTDSEIRRSMCPALTKMATNFGLKVTKRYLMEIYEELLNDEEDSVKIAAFLSVFDISSIFDYETKVTFYIPRFKALCEGSDAMQITALENFGKFVVSLNGTNY
jgi:hypothetical protein